MDQKGQECLGIRQWYTPADISSITADIVAVHGFGAHPYWTWVGQTGYKKDQRTFQSSAATSQPTREVFWLQTLLPPYVPSCRVLTFGYNSKYLKNAPKRDIANCARELLVALSRARSDDRELNRPIVFLGHSFGGIVIKEALVKATLATQYFGPIKAATCGIIFLGTPHAGSSIAGYGDMLVTATKAIGMGSDRQLLSSLRKSSAELLKLATNFVDIYQQFEIYCFYELLPWKFSTVIVDYDSAVIAGQPHDCLNTNHSGLNKYMDAGDANFVKIAKVLKAMAKSSAQRKSNNMSLVHPSTSPWMRAANLVSQIEQAFDKTVHRLIALDDRWEALALQRYRFQSWSYTLGLTSLLEMHRPLHELLNTSTDSRVCETLSKILETINPIIVETPSPKIFNTAEIVECLESLLCELSSYLPLVENSLMRHIVASRVLNQSDTSQSLVDNPSTTESSDLETIAAMRRINLLIQRSEARRTSDKLCFAINKEVFLDENKSSTRTPGRLSQRHAKGRTLRSVVIEWKKYQGFWDTEIGNALFDRVELLTEFLRTASRGPEAGILRFLECLGYCHDEKRTRLGFLFAIPASVSFRKSYISLNSLMNAYGNQQLLPPSVGDRMHLAWMLCTAMFEFHNAEWFHKKFNTHSILVFCETDQTNLEESDEPFVDASEFSILAPYIVGFDLSRPSKSQEFSEPAKISDEERRYQHPDYKSIPEQKYLHEFDYYSLGVVLLEIGQWTPLSSMMHGKLGYDKLDSFEFAQELRDVKCQQLRSFVGDVYEQVVSNLLNAFVEERLDLEQNQYVPPGHLLQFQVDVLEALATRRA